MARPIKNNCDYFPHRTTMRNHRKIKALRSTFGQVLGYAFWSMFVEYLTEQDGIELENSEIEIEMFAGELGVSAAEIRSMIDYCIKIELLFLTKDNFIYSDSLNIELQPVFEKRNREKEKSMTRRRHENGTFAINNTTNEGVSAAEIPQIIVDKIIVDKNKENNNNKAETFLKFETKDTLPRLYKDLIPECKLDEIWVESMCMNLGIFKEKVFKYFDDFEKKQAAEGCNSATKKEFKKHFFNYIKKMESIKAEDLSILKPIRR